VLHRTIRNLPAIPQDASRFTALQQTIMVALEPFPEAKAAVGLALENASTEG